MSAGEWQLWMLVFTLRCGLTCVRLGTLSPFQRTIVSRVFLRCIFLPLMCTGFNSFINLNWYYTCTAAVHNFYVMLLCYAVFLLRFLPNSMLNTIIYQEGLLRLPLFCLANIFPDFYPSSPWLCLSCQLYQGPLERTMVIILFNNCSLPLFPSIYQLYYSELYIAFLL